MKIKREVRITYCDKCYSSLRKCGGLITYIYETICEFYAIYSFPFPVMEMEDDKQNGVMVKYLEKKGYVVSTETLDYIAIKPTNHNFSIQKGHLFCCNPSEHCPDFTGILND